MYIDRLKEGKRKGREGWVGRLISAVRWTSSSIESPISPSASYENSQNMIIIIRQLLDYL